MPDLRARARIPFGYRIVDGKAQIDQEEAHILKTYFSLYLEGLSMAEAAHEAGLHCSTTSFRNLLKKKEYTGTDYYPAIISPEYQEKLMVERERRKAESLRKPKDRVPKGVRIYTRFRMEDNNPDDSVETMYLKIVPA